MPSRIDSRVGEISWARFCLPVRCDALRLDLIFSRELLVDPQEFLTFVHHADKTAEAGVFGFEQSVEFAQGSVFGARPNAAFDVGGIDDT